MPSTIFIFLLILTLVFIGDCLEQLETCNHHVYTYIIQYATRLCYKCRMQVKMRCIFL